MTLAPVWRTRLFAMIAALAAVWMGVAVAQGEFTWPLLLVAGLAALALVWWQPLPLATLLLGAALGGYIVGNRGFAQLSPSARLPLLPAELVLAIGTTLLLLQHAWRRELPWRRDAVNYALLVWIVVGAARLILDARAHGFAAIRDFAMVYYAGFFFLAQFAAAEPAGRRFLHACFLGSCTVLLATQPLFSYRPDFFLSTLTLRGVPVIFYKGDLTATFMAAAAIAAFLAYERTQRKRYLLLSLALTGVCLGTNNRASMLGLAVVALLLGLAGRWRFALVQAGTGIVAAIIVLFAAHLTDKPWQQTPLYGIYERVVSVIDPFGHRTYSGEDTFYKGDNNRFRSVWWKAVFDETVERNPWLGVGFGYDLAGRFVREYYPDAADEFSARSPHNVVLTVFARMGVVGLLPFIVGISMAVRQTMRCARAGPSQATALWSAALVIFVSACFGVVLEGPMGAVVFWTLLGLANASSGDSAPAPAETVAGSAGAAEQMEVASAPAGGAPP